MLERFTKAARDVVTRSQDEGRALGAPRIGPEHLLLALAHDEGAAGRTLNGAGLTHERMVGRLAELLAARRGLRDELDREGLAALGIDLDAVRERVEGAFGAGALDQEPDATTSRRRFGRRRREQPSPTPSGHLRFTDDAKKTLELSLREAVARQDRTIGSQHLLLGLLRLMAGGRGVSAQLVADLGADLGALRTRLDQELRDAA